MAVDTTKEKACIGDILRDALLLNESNPRQVINMIKKAPSCFKKGKPKKRTELSCEERLDNVSSRVDKAQHLIREGSPPALYNTLSEILIDISDCGNAEMQDLTRGLMNEIQQVTGDWYYKSEGKALIRKLEALDKLVESYLTYEQIKPTSGWAAPIFEETQATIEKTKESLGEKIRGYSEKEFELPAGAPGFDWEAQTRSLENLRLSVKPKMATIKGQQIAAPGIIRKQK